MRHVEFKEPDINDPNNAWYEGWKERATEETQKAIEAYETGAAYEFKQNIWREVKDYLFKLFNFKCAYCESKVKHVSSGDVEHFRPKQRVEGNETHRGYYWLAYTLRNLFPSCERCNRAGKMNKFPVEADSYVYGPDEDLSREHPLLLNPYDDDYPEKDLRFAPPINGIPIGTVTSSTPKGETSIKVYKLDRDELNTERSSAQANTLKDLALAVVRDENISHILTEIEGGERAYSAALFVVANVWFEKLYSQFEEFRNAGNGQPRRVRPLP